MAHAAPAPGGRAGRTGPTGAPSATDTTTGARGLPDVFSARTHRVASVAVPIVLGLLYGYWAAANRRSGGEITGWNLLFGFVTAAAFTLLYIAVRWVASRTIREVHALLWFAFTGSAFGFLYSQADVTVLRSAIMGAVIGAGFFAVLFYRYYTHEDAQGHRIR
ncbi:hypothetical protein J7F01_19285 [Streptomyces sp. ISL-22]|uniref:Uncharacterized protein n=1 Tax=Streptomyces curacoi TaxID=146536 RepID=A0A117PI19_9ACTN|nr:MULTISPECIES: hypothetical protein [Streptomyces]KUM80007.1 hypothetical protein AQI70_07450 [Streptomyces curacoi]MBT2418619.1 hypothetical protein [Streptomyces sp. ISL-24]MBT2434278.1 hypothetical protein [Streptomyces sp. ISL-22]